MKNKHINLRVNKNHLLLAIGAVSFFALGNFVSIVDAEGAGGIVIEKETMTVGSVVLRMDNVNPSTIYGGTWELLKGDASLRLGDGNSQTGSLLGNNTPAVVLPEHSHTMNHDHPVATTSTDTHDHNINLRRSGYTGAAAPSWHTDTNTVYPGITLTSGGNYQHDSRGPIDNDSHNHTLDLPNYAGSTGKEGVSGATMDVRGQYITINVWKRIS